MRCLFILSLVGAIHESPLRQESYIAFLNLFPYNILSKALGSSLRQTHHLSVLFGNLINAIFTVTMKKHLILPLVLLTLQFFCCRDKGTEPQPSSVQLIAEDVGVTEAWLRIKIIQNQQGGAVKINRDNQTFFLTQHAVMDTVILDDSLLPNHSYTYIAYRFSNNTPVDSSAPLSLTTMDTTSHNFTWDIQTIGVFQSSLNDVWGSSASDVWAVGSITDTTAGFFPNAAHFDGTHWTLVQIEEGFQIFGIFGFSSNNIYAVGTNGRVYHWNGINWGQQACLGIGDGCAGLLNGVPLTAVWGTSSNDLFVVGDSGVIVHYDGQTWTKMPSGTMLTMRDVWGFSSNDIYSAGADFFGNTGILLHYNGVLWQKVSVDSVDTYRHFSVWGNQKRSVITTGDFTYLFNGNKWNKLSVPDQAILKFRIRGVSINNFFNTGSFGLVLHFNGITWHRYDELASETNLVGVWSTNSEVYVVGRTNSLGVIVHGKTY